MSDQARQLSFITDEQILSRLRQLENGLDHAEVLVGSMRREVGELRRQLEPAPAPARAETV